MNEGDLNAFENRLGAGLV